MSQKSSIFGVEYITKIRAIFWGEQQKIGVIISSFKYLFYNFMFSIMRAGEYRVGTNRGIPAPRKWSVHLSLVNNFFEF